MLPITLLLIQLVLQQLRGLLRSMAKHTSFSASYTSKYEQIRANTYFVIRFSRGIKSQSLSG
jgi:hypothetical protein